MKKVMIFVFAIYILTFLSPIPVFATSKTSVHTIKKEQKIEANKTQHKVKEKSKSKGAMFQICAMPLKLSYVEIVDGENIIIAGSSSGVSNKF